MGNEFLLPLHIEHVLTPLLKVEPLPLCNIHNGETQHLGLDRNLAVLLVFFKIIGDGIHLELHTTLQFKVDPLMEEQWEHFGELFVPNFTGY